MNFANHKTQILSILSPSYVLKEQINSQNPKREDGRAINQFFPLKDSCFSTSGTVDRRTIHLSISNLEITAVSSWKFRSKTKITKIHQSYEKPASHIKILFEAPFFLPQYEHNSRDRSNDLQKLLTYELQKTFSKSCNKPNFSENIEYFLQVYLTLSSSKFSFSCLLDYSVLAINYLLERTRIPKIKILPSAEIVIESFLEEKILRNHSVSLSVARFGNSNKLLFDLTEKEEKYLAANINIINFVLFFDKDFSSFTFEVNSLPLGVKNLFISEGFGISSKDYSKILSRKEIKERCEEIKNVFIP
eukprot:snap_masked-scaffold_10-processed-gene-9.15-mRNA-1 protein AED:1.00 eAED:1.00 QI:0/-1/0/0/-1/1/1/0/303